MFMCVLVVTAVVVCFYRLQSGRGCSAGDPEVKPRRMVDSARGTVVRELDRRNCRVGAKESQYAVIQN
jgi:hypothetical protein